MRRWTPQARGWQAGRVTQTPPDPGRHTSSAVTSRGADRAVPTSRDGSPHVTDEKFNTVSHLLGACLALMGTALLVAQAAALGDPWKIVGLSIYGASLITLFVCSTLHHGLDRGPRVNDVLRTLDYTSVFFLIAGTVTPLVLVLFRDVYGWAVLGVVWGIAVLGIVLRSVWRHLPKYVTNTLYIGLGWMPVALLGSGVTLPTGALVLMAAGGSDLQRRLRDLRARASQPGAGRLRLPRVVALAGRGGRGAALPPDVPLRAARLRGVRSRCA